MTAKLDTFCAQEKDKLYAATSNNGRGDFTPLNIPPGLTPAKYQWAPSPSLVCLIVSALVLKVFSVDGDLELLILAVIWLAGETALPLYYIFFKPRLMVVDGTLTSASPFYHFSNKTRYKYSVTFIDQLTGQELVIRELSYTPLLQDNNLITQGRKGRWLLSPRFSLLDRIHYNLFAYYDGKTLFYDENEAAALPFPWRASWLDWKILTPIAAVSFLTNGHLASFCQFDTFPQRALLFSLSCLVLLGMWRLIDKCSQSELKKALSQKMKQDSIFKTAINQFHNTNTKI